MKKLLKRWELFYSNRSYLFESKVLAKRNIFKGRNNIIDKSVVFDTSKGGKIEIGKNCEILNGCLLMTYGGDITIGDNCSINPYTIIYGHGRGVSIGNNALIAAHTVIIPANHIFDRTDIPINQQGVISKGIIIEEGSPSPCGLPLHNGPKNSILYLPGVPNR